MAKKRVTRKKTKNRIRGKYAQSVGESWESIIENEIGRNVDLVLVKQHPETGFFGRGQARVVGSAWADFICMGKNLAFTFDAKTTTHKKKLTLPAKTSHQFFKLKLAAVCGIPAFYLTWWRGENVVAAHFVENDSNWPFVMNIDQTQFVAPLEPGWLNGLMEIIDGNKNA